MGGTKEVLKQKIKIADDKKWKNTVAYSFLNIYKTALSNLIYIINLVQWVTLVKISLE